VWEVVVDEMDGRDTRYVVGIGGGGGERHPEDDSERSSEEATEAQYCWKSPAKAEVRLCNLRPGHVDGPAIGPLEGP